MKKFFLAVSVLFSLNDFVAAQPCTPVDTTTVGGVLPLPCAKPGVNYNETTTVSIKTSTSLSLVTVYVCQVTLTNVEQLPPGSWMWELWKDGTQIGLGQPISLNPQNNTIERACLRFMGNGTVEDTFNVKVSASARVHASSSCNPNTFLLQIDTAFYIPFVVSAACGSVSEEVAEPEISNVFSVEQIQPNPATDQILLNFFTPRSGLVNFKISNLAGAVVEQKLIAAHAGQNQIPVNLRHLPRGLYTYSLTYRDKTITRRLMIWGY
ncbi:MAG: T9SS type A sorting domain-containing protein [Flavobacteriales bacterium]|nr:T9SS type A sorting domain-containing protein [Flavobacteriales bacterium]MDW8410991.1 T9SS type A sorting domain-containing protein [Flavobacteriales bacterium]